MKDNKLQAGVIGLHMGNAHCIGYRDNPHCDLVAICDVNPGLLEEKRKQYNVRLASTNYMDLVNDPEIDIISVTSPDYFHAEQCIAALKAGKHVMCEKPMTLTMEQSKAVIAEVEKGKAKFMIGQVCRYAPGFVLAKRLVSEGYIGDLYLVESEYAHNYTYARGADSWRVDARREPMVGGGCHAVDLLRWIAGDAVEVSAFANHKCLTDWPVNDCTIAIIKFHNDVIGKVMTSIGCTRPYTMRSVFYGTQGTIICDNTSPDIKICCNRLMQGKLDWVTLPVNIASHNVSSEIAELVNCIIDNKPVLTSVYEGAKTVATALAAAKSAAQGGHPVKVDDMFK